MRQHWPMLSFPRLFSPCGIQLRNCESLRGLDSASSGEGRVTFWIRGSGRVSGVGVGRSFDRARHFQCIAAILAQACAKNSAHTHASNPIRTRNATRPPPPETISNPLSGEHDTAPPTPPTPRLGKPRAPRIHATSWLSVKAGCGWADCLAS